MKIINTISGRGKEIIYSTDNDIIEIRWSNAKFSIRESVIEEIMLNFFIDNEKWYPLGACSNNPQKGGLGEYVALKHGFTPRCASAIAAIMLNEGLIQFRGQRPIELKRI
jgi:hypothetical protein